MSKLKKNIYSIIFLIFVFLTFPLIIDKILQSVLNSNISSETEDLVKLIFDHACIIEGEPIADIADFSQRINAILVKI